jgi:hypothetical protein
MLRRKAVSLLITEISKGSSIQNVSTTKLPSTSESSTTYRDTNRPKVTLSKFFRRTRKYHGSKYSRCQCCQKNTSRHKSCRDGHRPTSCSFNGGEQILEPLVAIAYNLSLTLPFNYRNISKLYITAIPSRPTLHILSQSRAPQLPSLLHPLTESIAISGFMSFADF